MRGILVLHADPATHLAATLGALDAGEPVFLGNPRWTAAQLDEALRQVPAGCAVAGAEAKPRGMGPCDWPQGWRGRLMIPTGGTGGKVRFVIHDRASLGGAARSLAAGLARRGLAAPLHGAVLTPPWHVSGLMPAIRARETGGAFVVADGRFRAEDPLPSPDFPTGGSRLASLVPAQLARLLSRPDGEAWLRRFDLVLLGGSSVPAELLASIRERRLPVAITYGMTETAAAMALAWAGETGDGALLGEPLPGVRLEAREGRLWVDAPGLCHGHWPASPATRPMDTGDLGEVDGRSRVRVTGRADRIVATGGEKVDLGRVEQALVGPGLASSAWAVGLPDATWGRLIVAVVVARPDLEPALRAAAEHALEPAARPRRYVFMDALPYDAQGKLDPARLA